MKPDQSTLLARQHGKLPDKYWYQMNNKPAEENWREQHAKQLQSLSTADDDIDSLHVTSEVKVK